MCRSTEIHGFYQPERDRLKIKAFYLRLQVSPSTKTQNLSIPESLTLLYLPRINGSPLQIEDAKIRPDSPAFVTLYRVRSEEDRAGEAVFASRERVRASEGVVRFEVYSREEKVLKGIFRKEDEWRLMDLRSALECEPVGFRVSEAEVCVVVEGHVAIVERVDMAVMKRRRKQRGGGRGGGFRVLEEIPEEREEVDDEYCNCCCGDDDDESGSSDGGYCEKECDEEEMESDGAKWAVDVGIWVMCLGVGYLVTKASSRSLLRRRTRVFL